MNDNQQPEKTPEQMSGDSLDISELRRKELKQLFPGVFTESTGADGQPVETIDFERLKAELGTFSDIYEGRRERYGMEWPGKRDCMKLIQEPSRATLKPCREESVDFDTTQNLFIEGDNLEVLKLLQKSFYGKVKMIYIDPPYNTGKEFIYPDKYSESLETYLAYAGLVDDEGKKFSTNTATEGRFHTKWLNMMYPRLYLARNLLREDGFFLVSIDDAEKDNLKKIVDEILGAENFLAVLVWDRNRKNDAKYVSIGHEYMLVYAKNVQHLLDSKVILREAREGLQDAKEYFDKLYTEHGQDWEKVRAGWLDWFKNIPVSDPRRRMMRFSKVGPRGPYRDDRDISWPGGGGPRYEVKHPITGNPIPVPSRGWVFPTPERFWEEYKKGTVVFGEDDTTSARKVSYLFEAEGQVLPSVFYSYAQTAAQDFSSLMGGKVFDNPKNWKDISRLIRYFSEDGDIVLDFFAGSATTAHSVLDVNSKAGSRRRFIAVQLPEPCGEKTMAFKKGYRNISAIAKERIKRAADMIREEYRANLDSDAIGKLDLGYKVFALHPSNFKQWQMPMVECDVEHLTQQLELHVNHIGNDTTQESILYELLLKAGFMPNERIESLILAGKRIYSIAEGVLIICLEEELTSELIDAVADEEPMQFICLDKGFKGNDQLKANAVQTLKSRSQGAETEMVFKVV